MKSRTVGNPENEKIAENSPSKKIFDDSEVLIEGKTIADREREFIDFKI
jgi:hypothetical protein